MSIDSQNPRDGRELPSDAELIREARSLMPAVDAEPRPGFAARVAARAAEAKARPLFAGWWRFALAGGGLVAAAAALFIAFSPHRQLPQQDEIAFNDRSELIMGAPGGELAMAQHLELYEELTLVQNQDALEDIDVVEVLHELRPVAKP